MSDLVQSLRSYAAAQILPSVKSPVLEAADKIERLVNAIREHRDQRGDDRCWEDDAQLYAVLGESTPARTVLPPKCEFLESCSRYWSQRQNPGERHPYQGMTISQLQKQVQRLSRMQAYYVEYDNSYENSLERVDKAACDYFESIGKPMPFGSTFGEATDLLPDELKRLHDENERLRSEIGELKRRDEGR